ncbi:MAG: hypothetical protein K8F62_17880 [Pseudorhodoplanes sp.]|nr:hypothetical protein [Pseudorhodoplanes sp.]
MAMEGEAINRRAVMAGGLAAMAAVAAPAMPESGALSPAFCLMRDEMEAALTAFRAVRDDLERVKPQLIKQLRRDGRRNFGWYFRQPEVIAESRARMKARAAAEGVFVNPAANNADRVLQLHALDVYEADLGDRFGIARTHFSRTSSA